MINALRINEAVASEMKRMGVGRKPLTEAEDEKKSDKPKRIDVKVTTKSDSWVTGFNGTLEEAKAYFMGKKFETKDEKPGDPVTSVTLVSGVKESQRSERKLITEGDEAKEVGTEDKQFDAPTTKEVLDQKPEGVDKGHDEAGEEEDDPTREKLETPQDEKDEMKGGAAELAADLRVSVRIERMNMGRYKKMLDKHDLSEDGQNWLKEKMADIQSTIDDMLERIPKLEAEAKEQEGGEEKIKECMKVALKKAIVEIAAG